MTGTERAGGKPGPRSRPRAPQPQLTPAERATAGKAARAVAPRDRHAIFEPAAGRPDPVSLLEQQAATRIGKLVQIRYGRMLASPLAFFRGAALPMAADLAGTPRTGLTVQLSGDAHLSNFGSSRRRNAASSSISTTSTRHCPARGNGISSGWPRAWKWRHAAAASPAGTAADRGGGRRALPPGDAAFRPAGKCGRLVRARGTG